MTSIKGNNSVSNLGKNDRLQLSYCNLDIVNINAHTKFGQILSIFILKILSGNKIPNTILTSIKGHNSVFKVWL